MKAEQMNAEETGLARMRARQWKTYRTRFLVKAKQLRSSLVFTDALGRRHSGRKGDYLVESSDGVLSIAPRQIFEDIYVSMQTAGAQSQHDASTLCLDEPARVRHKFPEPCSAVGPGGLSGTRGQGSGVSDRERFCATSL
jgi:hypothetical protein